MGELDDLKENQDQFFLIVIAIIIFFMQCGFAFLEAGSVRSKNTVNILIKNILDAFIGGVSYWAIGWGLAYGGGGNPFCGGSEFFGYHLAHGLYAKWFFQFVFAATAATIVSGAIAERCQFGAYFVYSTLVTGWVYPPVSHWAWDGGREEQRNVTAANNGSHWVWEEFGGGSRPLEGGAASPDDARLLEITATVGTGWLSATGFYRDFAGSGVVHLLGGTCALVATYFMGARKGRFTKQGRPINMPGHSVPLAGLGGFILIFGFLAFNGGSQASISSAGDGAVVGLAIVNTILGGCAGGLCVLFFNRLQGSHWSFLMTLNGALAGMVALCAGCDAYEPWAALVVGFFAGLSFIGVHYAMLAGQMDDPLDAVAVHGGGGLCGLFLLPFFMNGTGIFWTGADPQGDGAMTLAFNIAGAVCIITWSAFWSALMFFPLSYFRVFRIGRDMEFRGVDIVKHGEAAYPAEAWVEIQYNNTKLGTSGSVPAHMGGGGRESSEAYNNPFEMMPAQGKLFTGMNNAFSGFSAAMMAKDEDDDNKTAVDNRAFEEESGKENV